MLFTSTHAPRVQAQNSTAFLAKATALIAVAGAITLNASHVLASNAGAGTVQAIALAALFGSIALGGAVAAHLVVEARGAQRATACLALLISLSVSVLVSIGAQSAGRSEQSTKATGQNVNAVYNANELKRLNEQLAGLAPSRTTGEIRAALAAASVPRWALAATNDCATPSTPDQRAACKPRIELQSELARSERRENLETSLAKIGAPTGATRDADAQASTVAWLLGMAGFKPDHSDVGRGLNVLLALLAEASACLSASLAAIASRSHEAKAQVEPVIVPPAAPITALPAPVIAVPTVQPVAPAAQLNVVQDAPDTQAKVATVPVTAKLKPRRNQAEQIVLAALRRSGGSVALSGRALAERLGLPKSTAAAALSRLAGEGLVRVDGGRIALAA